MGGDTVASGREMLKSAAIPCYNTPEEAVRTYMSMYRYARNLELLYETPAELPIDIAPPKHNLQAMLRRVVRSGRSVLTEEESKRFITTYGFPVAPQIVAETVDEALAAAAEDRLSGGPQGGRARDHAQELRSAASRSACARRPTSRRAYERMHEASRARTRPRRRSKASSVQKMVRKVDYELILGMKKDRAVRLGDRVRSGRRRRRGPGGLLGESAAAQPDARPPDDGGDAHLPDDPVAETRRRGPGRRASSRSCSPCSRTSSSTSPRSPRSIINPLVIADGQGVRGRRAHRHRHGRHGGQAGRTRTS